MKYTTTLGVDVDITPIELSHTGTPKYVALRQVMDAYAEFEAAQEDMRSDGYWESFNDLRKALENLCNKCGLDPQVVSIGDAVPLVTFWNSGALPVNFTPAESPN